MVVQNLLKLANANNQREQALTEIEVLGLASTNDLANGHASQELSLTQRNIIDRLPEIWMRGMSMKSRQAELMFKDAFARLSESPSLKSYEHFKICPTASNSIDTVATWLAANQLKTALIEPTFDNLALILKRRGVHLTAMPEQTLHEISLQGNAAAADKLAAQVDAIFLVNPNNPTGQSLSERQFAFIAEWCFEHGKILVLDNTFRFFMSQNYDSYKILLESGVTFLSIEDTGKVWPTQEIKASLLFTSSNIFTDVDLIYDEIFLCHSNFALGVLSEFLNDAAERSLAEAVWKDVAINRAKFREAIDGTVLSINPLSMNSTISVEWVNINGFFKNDMELVEYFQSKNLVILPGRQFYWSKSPLSQKTDCVRFALLKAQRQFDSSVEVLAKQLRRLNP